MYICFHTFIYAALDGLVVKFWFFFFFLINYYYYFFFTFSCEIWTHTHTHTHKIQYILIINYGWFWRFSCKVWVVFSGDYYYYYYLRVEVWKCMWVGASVDLFILCSTIYIYIYSWVQVINSVTLSNVTLPNNLL